MAKTFNPTSVRKPFGHYNHGLMVPPGASLLVTSGQLGIAVDDTIPEGVTAQAELCFQAIEAILAEAGMDFSDVIRISGFVTAARILRPTWRCATVSRASRSRSRH